MTCNVGGVERPIRIVVGIALLGIGAFAGLPPVGTGIALVSGRSRWSRARSASARPGPYWESIPVRRRRIRNCQQVKQFGNGPTTDFDIQVYC